VRLVRSGNTVTGYESSDGANWTLAMSRTFAFPATIFVGLAVTSHNDSTTTTATFTNITTTTGTPPPPPPVTVNAPSGLSASVASGTQINLPWSDNSTNETGFEIERAVGTGGFSALASIGADRTGHSDTAVTAGTAYSYRVRAVAGTVTSSFSNTVSATPTAAPPPPPPTSWSFGDIGAVGVAGSNSSSGNTITVRGSGSDIWESADSFRFVYRAITGDGVVEAQVTSLENTNGWAKAGVMIRESLTAGSRNAFAFLTPGTHGVVAQSREATNGQTRSVSGPFRTAPHWVRLTRAGSTITAAHSPDGVTWTTYATFTIPMNTTVFFGLAVTSHNNGLLNTAVFTDPFVR
jgi:regulation of enolase protein 1 (concanavalin A-like superfamily)